MILLVHPAACPVGGAGRAFGVWARHTSSFKLQASSRQGLAFWAEALPRKTHTMAGYGLQATEPIERGRNMAAYLELRDFFILA